MVLWIWSGLLLLKIDQLILSFGHYLWWICGETLVSFEIRIVLNFRNRFKLLAYLPIYWFLSLFFMLLGFLRSNITVTSFIINLVIPPRTITTTWLVVAVHFFTRTGWDSLKEFGVVKYVLQQRLGLGVYQCHAVPSHYPQPNASCRIRNCPLSKRVNDCRGNKEVPDRVTLNHWKADISDRL